MYRLSAMLAFVLLGSVVNLWSGQPATRTAIRPPQRQEPAEFTGAPKRLPPAPSAVLVRSVQSDAIRVADKEKPDTIATALEAITSFIKEDPAQPLFRFVRAGVPCEAGAEPKHILEDLSAATSQLTTPEARAFVNVQSVLALKAKIEIVLGQHEAAMSDLDAAIREDYDSGIDVFNDGEVEPRTQAAPCELTQAGIDLLAKRFPKDHRPALYFGLYHSFFLRFKNDANHTPVTEAYERATELNPASPLPHYYLGAPHAFGSIGGLMSTKHAECLDYVVPRMPACVELDAIRRLGLRHFTRAIAVDPSSIMRGKSFGDVGGQSSVRPVRVFETAKEIDESLRRIIHATGAEQTIRPTESASNC